MHDLSPNPLEHVPMIQENNFEFPMSGEHGTSPLQEILAQEMGFHEAPNFAGEYQEAHGYELNENESEYQESPYQESPYQEVHNLSSEYHEAPYNEAPFHEAAYQESPYHEASMYETEYHESPLGEVYGETEMGHEYSGEYFESFSHEDELSMAAELLEIQSEEELDQFLGKLVRRVARGAGRFLKSPAGNMLKNVLRQVAKRALPIAGKALGTFIGGPVGGIAAGYLTNMAGQALGLETQGMSEDEANFASARQFVRFATDAARRAALSVGDPRNINPNSIASTAVQAAAQRFAPGLLGPQYGRLPVAPIRSGRRGVWVRRGQTITLYGV